MTGYTPCEGGSRWGQQRLERLFDPVRLDQLFHEAADDQYHRELLFSDVLHIMLTVVLRTTSSVHAAYRDSREQLGVSHQALYDKLKRMDDAVTEAVVADSAASLIAEQVRSGLVVRMAVLYDLLLGSSVPAPLVAAREAVA